MWLNFTVPPPSWNDSDDIIPDTCDICTGNVTFPIGGGIVWMTRNIWPGMFANLAELVVITSRYCTGVVALVGVLFNALAFGATRKACPKTLKSKHLIQNAILADAALAIVSLHVVVRYMLKAYRASSERVVATLGQYAFVTAMYTQQFATVLLACDRMYAVARPFDYHALGYNRLCKILLIAMPWTIAVLLACDRMYAVARPFDYHALGYNRLCKILLIAMPWTTAVALVLPGLVIAFTGDHLAGAPLHQKLNYGLEETLFKYREYFLIAINVAIFLLYVLIFVVLDRQRRSNQALGKSSSADSTKTSALSLTLTYFLIHVSSLCLYLPGPVFKTIRKDIPTDVMSNNVKSIINRAFVTLYIFNTVLDPIILGLRVRSIRHHLVPVLKPIIKKILRQKKRQKVDVPKAT